jgi:hypothetical protein
MCVIIIIVVAAASRPVHRRSRIHGRARIITIGNRLGADVMLLWCGAVMVADANRYNMFDASRASSRKKERMCKRTKMTTIMVTRSAPTAPWRILLVRHSPRQQQRHGTTTAAGVIGRAPLPPTPRRFPFVATTAGATTTSTSSTLPNKQPGLVRRSWDNGSILIGLGWLGAVLMAVDRLLQYQQRRTKEDSGDMILAIAEEARRRRTALYEACQNKPALYRCTIVREYKSMGGSHGLRNVKIGDVVEVLEENVGLGHEKNYHLCRVVDDEDNDDAAGGKVKRIGWYPIGFMERIQPEKRRRRWWWFSPQ